MEELRFLTVAAVKYDLYYYRVYGREYIGGYENKPSSIIGYLWAKDEEEARKYARDAYGEDYSIDWVEQEYFTNGEPVTGKKQEEYTKKCLVKF